MNNLDQHFLKDSKIVQAMIKAGEINSNDIILEIGPGKGILTKEIALKAGKVIAIEIDERMSEYLNGLPDNVEIVYGNALDEMRRYSFNKIIASIPYSITEPLFKRMLCLKIDSAVLLTGMDFYELLNGKPDKKDALGGKSKEAASKWAVIGKIFFDIKKIKKVPPSSFDPEPRVDSAIVLFKKRTKELNDAERMIKEIVLQDDKKTKNALMHAFMRVRAMTKRQARAAIAAMGLDTETLDRNSDALSNEQFKTVIEKL